MQGGQKLHKTVKDIIEMKRQKEKISVITAYDYTMATLCDRADVDIMLVGDSAGMVVLGYDSTIPVTIQHMCFFTNAVSRARKSALIVADLPFMSYQASVSDAIRNSGKLIKAGADAVKLEGGTEMAQTINAIIQVGIPVMGHIGLQPQTTMLSDGYKVQGKTVESAQKLIADAISLEKAGVFSITLEMVSHQVAEIISNTVSVPTIGIGSGADCDGQVLVAHDLLGMYDKINPKFVKKYDTLSQSITNSVKNYVNDIKSKRFPSEENCFAMDAETLRELNEKLQK